MREEREGRDIRQGMQRSLLFKVEKGGEGKVEAGVREEGEGCRVYI